MTDLINKKNNFFIDHIALAVNNTEEGMRYIKELTGVEPYLPEGQNQNWYKSAAVGLGNNAFLEIIGPNPSHKKFHPFKQILKEIKKPKLIFWYLSTQRFSDCKKVIKNTGHIIERYNHIRKEVKGKKIDYEIGVIGKGFESERPSLIQWNEVPEKNENMKHICAIKNFVVKSEQYSKMNKLFQELGADIKIEKGIASMELQIESPKGIVTLKGGGFSFPSGVKALVKILPLFKRHLFNK